MSPQASIMNVHIYIYIHSITKQVQMFRLTTVLLPYLRDEPHPFTILHQHKEAGSDRLPSIHFQGSQLAVSFRGPVCLHPSIVDVLDVLLLPRRKSLAPPWQMRHRANRLRGSPPEVPKNYCFLMVQNRKHCFN